MKVVKSLLALGIILSIVLCFPITGLPAPVLSFTYGEPPGMPVEDLLVFKEWQKRTGVSIKWNPVPSPTFGDKIQLLLGSGDVTDITLGPVAMLNSFGSEALLPLDDLIDKYAPNIKKHLQNYAKELPQIRAADGKLYVILGRMEYMHQGWLYRKDLAKKLGFSESNLKTLEDWYKFLKAAKQSDPEIHGVGLYGNVLGLAFNLRGAFGIHGQLSDWLTVRGGKIVDGSILPEARSVIETVRKWYTEGLVDPDMVKTVEDEQNQQKWLAGKSILAPCDYFGYADLTDVYRSTHPGSDFEIAPIIPPQGPKGDQAKVYNFFGWGFFGYALGKNCKDPVAAIKFLDYIFSEEGAKLYFLGVEGETFEVKDKEYRFTEKFVNLVKKAAKDEGRGVTEMLWKYYGIGYPFFTSYATAPFPAKWADIYVGVSVSKRVADGQKMTTPYVEEKIPTPVFTPEERKKLDTLLADIRTYRSETWTKMIIGQLPMSKWNDYVLQMKKLGISEVENIYNTAYLRTYGKKPALGK